MLGAFHLHPQLWPEVVKTAMYICHQTPTDALHGMAPLEEWTGETLGDLKHMYASLVSLRTISIFKNVIGAGK